MFDKKKMVFIGGTYNLNFAVKNLLGRITAKSGLKKLRANKLVAPVIYNVINV